ncbi:RRQRL motif-containing zinc-binding protein [Streptomyces sp. NPDC047071]|uniref:RRQRL motif-containing zinc-binding protein n=1 Tax=Streptomyces sp. NPDC047071 TaxID=3154808 RepID=UPI0034524A15
MGLRPGGHEPVTRIECRGGKRWAWLFRIDLAKPKFAMTVAKEAALERAMAARQTCPGPCGRRYVHSLLLKALGSCLGCFDGTPADPGGGREGGGGRGPDAGGRRCEQVAWLRQALEAIKSLIGVCTTWCLAGPLAGAREGSEGCIPVLVRSGRRGSRRGPGGRCR